MDLAVADVERHHVGRAPLQEAVGEAAGGRAGVEHPQARRVQAEPLQRTVELLPAPSHEAGPFTLDQHRFTGIDQAGGLERRTLRTP